MASVPFIWTQVSESTLFTVVRRRAGSGRKVNVQWDSMYVRLIDPRTGQLLREHLGQKCSGHRIRDGELQIAGVFGQSPTIQLLMSGDEQQKGHTLSGFTVWEARLRNGINVCCWEKPSLLLP